MGIESQSGSLRDQDNVWAYFQTDGASIFDFAVPRLAYLFRRSVRWARGRHLRVLNIGIGNGWLEVRCARQGWEAFALDPVKEAVDGVAAKGVRAIQGSIDAMPFPDGSFDVVYCSEVLEHLGDELLARGLAEIRRVLAPEGILLGTVPFEENLILRHTVCPHCSHQHHAYGHHQSFTRARVAQLLSAAGLHGVDYRIRAFPGFKRRNLAGKLKSLVWVAAGRFGATNADPKIVFMANPRRAG